jgi:hypothetical protein
MISPGSRLTVEPYVTRLGIVRQYLHTSLPKSYQCGDCGRSRSNGNTEHAYEKKTMGNRKSKKKKKKTKKQKNTQQNGQKHFCLF